MAIFLRQDIMIRQIARLDGGLDSLVGAWEALSEDDEDYVRPKQKSSIYRWLQKGIPTRGEEILAICGLVDVDPLSVFDYHKNGYFDEFASIRRNIQLGLHMVGALAPIYNLYRPGPHWPADVLSKRYWSRPWFSKEFSNTSGTPDSGYALVGANFKEAVDDRPRAIHIAYRRIGSRDTMWRYYGVVISINNILQLYSEGGDFQEMPNINPNCIAFRTYLGERPVEFRVASLHDFEFSLEFPFYGRDVVGFEW
jgi:hypothetical protein